MFRKIQGAVARSEAHGHQTMNDTQQLIELVRKIVVAAAEDVNETIAELKSTLAEVKDGVTIETQIKVDWTQMMSILAALKLGVTPSVDVWPVTLVNRIVLEEKA